MKCFSCQIGTIEKKKKAYGRTIFSKELGDVYLPYDISFDTCSNPKCLDMLLSMQDCTFFDLYVETLIKAIEECKTKGLSI